jgi:hypothetical protein
VPQWQQGRKVLIVNNSEEGRKVDTMFSRKTRKYNIVNPDASSYPLILSSSPSLTHCSLAPLAGRPSADTEPDSYSSKMPPKADKKTKEKPVKGAQGECYRLFMIAIRSAFLADNQAEQVL